jgi:hypothetical protein
MRPNYERITCVADALLLFQVFARIFGLVAFPQTDNHHYNDNDYNPSDTASDHGRQRETAPRSRRCCRAASRRGGPLKLVGAVRCPERHGECPVKELDVESAFDREAVPTVRRRYADGAIYFSPFKNRNSDRQKNGDSRWKRQCDEPPSSLQQRISSTISQKPLITSQTTN